MEARTLATRLAGKRLHLVKKKAVPEGGICNTGGYTCELIRPSTISTEHTVVAPNSQTDELTRAQERVGMLIDAKWKVESVLGVGGMASVYAAVHQYNQRKVAIKILHQEYSHLDDIRERFALEARAANRVDHRGAVPVLDDGVLHTGTPYMVMEFLDGHSLQHRWEQNDYLLSVGEVFAVTERLLEILEAAHKAGVLHRDIKPENVFLTTDGEVKLLDFGISKMSGVDQSHKTEIGATMGTPSFMSPEQARGRWEELDPRADLFAVGATMYSLLSGQTIHEADTANELLLKVMTEPVRDLRSVAPHVPEMAAHVVNAALAFDKKNRYPSAAAMALAVRAVNERYSRAEQSLLSGDELGHWIAGDHHTPTSHRATHRPVMFSEVESELIHSTSWSRRQKLTAAAVALVMLVTSAVSFSYVRSQDSSAGSSLSPVFAPSNLHQVNDAKSAGSDSRLDSKSATEAIQLSDLPEDDRDVKHLKKSPDGAHSNSANKPNLQYKRPQTIGDSAPDTESAPVIDTVVDPLERRR